MYKYIYICVYVCVCMCMCLNTVYIVYSIYSIFHKFPLVSIPAEIMPLSSQSPKAFV